LRGKKGAVWGTPKKQTRNNKTGNLHWRWGVEKKWGDRNKSSKKKRNKATGPNGEKGKEHLGDKTRRFTRGESKVQWHNDELDSNLPRKGHTRKQLETQNGGGGGKKRRRGVKGGGGSQDKGEGKKRGGKRDLFNQAFNNVLNQSSGKGNKG